MALSARLRANGVVHEALYFFEGEEAEELRVSMSPGMKGLISLPLSKKSSKGAHP
jgi:hypothetical protein